MYLYYCYISVIIIIYRLFFFNDAVGVPAGWNTICLYVKSTSRASSIRLKYVRSTFSVMKGWVSADPGHKCIERLYNWQKFQWTRKKWRRSWATCSGWWPSCRAPATSRTTPSTKARSIRCVIQKLIAKLYSVICLKPLARQLCCGNT